MIKENNLDRYSVKKFSSVIWVSIILFLFPLFLLPFFNYPSTDDFYIPDLIRSMGFWEVQNHVYQNWGARYSFNFISAFGNWNHFVLNHYYFHSMALIIGQLIASVFFIHNFLKYGLSLTISKSEKWFLGLVFYLVQLVSLPEMSTWYFWFSSAITYSLPTILLFFQLGLLFRYYQKRDLWSIFVILILTVILVGSNEVFVVIQGVTLFVFAMLTYRNKVIFRVVLLMVLVLSLSAGFYLLSSGNQYRFGIIPSKSPVFYVLSTLVQFPIIFWSIFKNPLFWFFGFTVFMVLKPYQELILSRFGNSLRYILFVFFGLLILTIVIPVIGLKGSMLPLRLVNVLVVFSVMSCMAVFALLALKRFQKRETLLLNFSSKYFLIVFVVVLFANHFTADSYQSLISAFYRSKIHSKQLEAMKRAGEEKGVLRIKNFNCELDELTENQNVTLAKIVKENPPFFMSFDFFSDENSLEFLIKHYGLEKVIIEDCKND
ncbi:MAG: hypothetical protein JXR34_01260 [Bacteroidales bacterium]|nr:hypothetical protein [Bacteroidales bacterium]